MYSGRYTSTRRRTTSLRTGSPAVGILKMLAFWGAMASFHQFATKARNPVYFGIVEFSRDASSGMRSRLKTLLPYHLGLCELVDRRLDKSGRRLVLPNGLLQTFDHIGTQGHLAAPVADFSRYVVDQDQAVGH